ncbi:hypothetical protein [Flavobacterium psychrotrophum]|uniref:hypothetical protein n=1 Tax=Flavobacterium psychrotrophum TaxID=2294119 RepID=UPI000E31BFED|nr:hypothetical protein [Flavobacterium psychrotrophum]
MKLLKFAGLLLLLAFFGACNSNDEDSVNKFTITLEEAQNISAIGAQFTGTITFDNPNDIKSVGLLWSMSPSIIDQVNEGWFYGFVETVNVSGSTFSSVINSKMIPDSMYYVCVVLNTKSGKKIYSNEISFITSSSISSSTATDILTKSAVLTGNVTQASNKTTTVGFVYNTSPNPTINNNKRTTTVTGSDSFSISVKNLAPNTTYYARSVNYLDSGEYSYGNEIQFKTTGYTGPASGYVVYDKGKSTDGWRYMEIYPQTLNYSAPNGAGAQWGSSTYIPGTYMEIGTGQANSDIIAVNTSSANCAAKLCLNYTKNGYSDWFLGSAEEMHTITNALYDINIRIDGPMWTSSQSSATAAYMVNYKSASEGYVLSSTYDYKNLTYKVYPVRKY